LAVVTLLLAVLPIFLIAMDLLSTPEELLGALVGFVAGTILSKRLDSIRIEN
jgi:hypothetical protein